ncbi:hypothetical protein ACFFK0_23070 [Paenibacillus chartarius]|uniref:Uncharacterized protein n=1 Tax=Paenibacillus chartarius TaxID=747481 RepID=A0ABV6DRK5_9BACL
MKEAGWQVIYIGDGSSDVYGSAFADWTFARAYLARQLQQSGEPAFAFETFHDVLEVLRPNIESFRMGTMPGRSRGDHPFCSF